jgi:thioredoxin reductase (NADPH)
VRRRLRWLDAPGCAALVGAGVYYGAATVEASACRDQEIYVLGGGNSARQVALFLAGFAR